MPIEASVGSVMRLGTIAIFDLTEQPLKKLGHGPVSLGEVVVLAVVLLEVEKASFGASAVSLFRFVPLRLVWRTASDRGCRDDFRNGLSGGEVDDSGLGNGGPGTARKDEVEVFQGHGIVPYPGIVSGVSRVSYTFKFQNLHKMLRSSIGHFEMLGHFEMPSFNLGE